MPLREHILAVDDEQTILRLMTLLLADAGYRCTTAESAQEARRQLADTAFELALCDMTMPEESGLDLVRHLADEYPGHARGHGDCDRRSRAGAGGRRAGRVRVRRKAVYRQRPPDRDRERAQPAAPRDREPQPPRATGRDRARSDRRAPRDRGAPRGVAAGAAAIARGDDPAPGARGRVPSTARPGPTSSA